MPPLDEGSAGTGEANRAERAELVRLIDDRVLPQGNVFIKSFLRDHGLTIGAVKQDFRRNLLDGFDAGEITKRELEDWLGEVEGWGAQRIHLFAVAPGSKLARDARRKLDTLGLPSTLESTVELPAEPSLGCATYDGKALRLVWGLRSEIEIRVREKDRVERVGRRRYLFKAYLLEDRVRIFRFEVRFDLGLAVLLAPLTVTRKAADRAAVTAKLAAEVGADLAVQLVAISEVIKNIDQREAEGGEADIPGLTSEVVRLDSLKEPTWVEFGTEDETRGLQGTVLEVRRAIKRRQLETFAGARADLRFRFGSEPASERNLAVRLDGVANDVEIRKAATAPDVWAIVEILNANRTLAERSR